MRAPPFFMPTITGQAIDFLLQHELVILDPSGDVPVLKRQVAGEEIRTALVGEFGEDWEVQDFIRHLNAGQLSPHEQLARSPAVRMAVPLPPAAFKAFTREWFEAIPFEHPSVVLVKYADGSWQKLVVFVSNILENISSFFAQDNAGRLVLLAFPDGGGIGWGAALKAEIYHALNTGKKIESPPVEFYLPQMATFTVDELLGSSGTTFDAGGAEYSVYDPQNPGVAVTYSLPASVPAYLAPADVKLGTQYWFEAHRLSTPGLIFIGTQKFLFFINDENKSILFVTHIYGEPELRLGLVTTKDLPLLVFGRFRQALLQTLGSHDRVVKDMQFIDDFEDKKIPKNRRILRKMLLLPDPTDASGHRQVAIPLALAEFSPQGAQIPTMGSYAVESQTIVHKGGGRQRVVYHAMLPPQQGRFLSELWFHGLAHDHPAAFRVHDGKGYWQPFVLMNVNSSDDILSYVTVNGNGQLLWTSLLCTVAKHENAALRRDLREALAQGRDIDNPALLARLLTVENIYEVEKILGRKQSPYGFNTFQIRGNCLINDVELSNVATRYVYSLYEPPHESTHPAYSAAWFDEYPESHPAVFWLQDGSDAWHKCILLVPAPEARFYSFVTKGATGRPVLFLQPCEDDLTEAARLAVMDALHTPDKKVYSTKLTFAPGEKYYDLDRLRDGIRAVAGESSDVQLRIQGNAVLYQRGPGSDIASHYTFTIPHQVVEVPTAREHKVFTPAWFKALRIDDPGVLFTRDRIKVVWMPAPAGKGFALVLEHRGRLYAGLAKAPNPEDQKYFDCLTQVFHESQTGNRLTHNLSVELTDGGDTAGSVLAAVIKLWNPPIPGAAWGGYKVSFYDLGPAIINIPGYGWLKKVGNNLVVEPQRGKRKLVYELPQGSMEDGGAETGTSPPDREGPADHEAAPVAETPLVAETDPNEVAVEVVVPDSVATALVHLSQLNEGRAGIGRLALDLSQWGKKPFVISRPDSPFALQLGVGFEPRGYEKGYTRGAFRRHSRGGLRQATYTFHVKWGKNSSTVAYRVAGENPNFVLELADQKFPYAGKVVLRFNPQAREGTEDAWFEVERGSALHQFLDGIVAGPKLFVDRDDGGIVVRAEWDADGALLQQIWEIWGELLPGATKAEVAVATDGAWEFRVPNQAAQENLVAAKLSLTGAVYDASVRQKREPMWKRPAEPVETKPTEPPKVVPELQQFSFATQFVKLALDPSRDPQLKPPHVVAEVEVKKAADGHCISHRLKNLTMRGQAISDKTVRVVTTHGEFKLAALLGPNPSRLTLIREVTMPEAGWETITLELLVSEAGVAQMIGVEEAFVTVKDKTTKLSTTTQIALSKGVLVDDFLTLTAFCIEDPLFDRSPVHLQLAGPFGQKKLQVEKGAPCATFDLGPLYGPITYNLTWQKNALVASRAVMDVAFFKERNPAGKLQIHCLADNSALLKVDVEEVKEGWQERLFVSTNQAASLTRWLGIVGANFSFDPDFHTHVEVVEVGSDIHLHPIRSLGNFKPLTWLSLDHRALEALRDALYPKPIAALHGELTDDPTAVAIISPVPKAISLPDSHLLRFAGHESFVPTENTVTMIADASFRFYDGGEWKLGMSFAEGSLYWYDVQGGRSGTRLRIPVIWSPHRFTNPWVLDENRSLRIYDEGELPDSARIVADNHVVMEDRGGEWLVTYFEAKASSQTDGTVTIKRWELVASPDPESPLFVHLYNHLGEDRSFVAKQARIARDQSQEKMQTWIGRVLADRGKKVPSHEFGEQKIQPTEGRLVTLKYRATQSGNIQVAHLEGVQYVAQGLGQKPALVFPGPLTLTIHTSFDSPDVLETYSLVAVEPPRNADGQIYLLELKDKEMTGRFFVWHPLTGTLVLREQLGDVLSREAFAAIIKGQNLPFTPAGRQRSYTPRPRTYDPQALMEVDERIPVLPVAQRGYTYPQHIERVTGDELVQKLLAELEETVFYPEEESLFAQVLNGRSSEVMTFTSVNGAILQVPMHLAHGNYVAASQANPHTGLSGVRLLVPNREKAGSFYDLPCFVHPRRGTGRRPILRLLVGSEQRLFTFIQWSQAQTVGREAFLFHAAATDKHRTAPANVIKELGALIEYNGLEKDTPPITPVAFEFGKNITLPDGRVLELKVLHHPGRHPPYALSGYEIIQPEGMTATAATVRYHELRKKNYQSMMLYRAASGGATYFLRANSGKFLRMVISDKGIPLFYERPPGVQHYQQAAEHEFLMVRIKGGHYVSEATSVAKRIQDTEVENTFEIRAALGRGQGSTRMHVDLDGGSRAFVKFKVGQKRDGTIVVGEAFIKQEGKGNPWEASEVEVTTKENGPIHIFLRSATLREGNYRDYAWLEFAGLGGLLGEEFKVFQAHYNMTNSPAAQLMPSEPGFVNMMSGAATTATGAAMTLYAFAAEWRDPLEKIRAALQEKFGDEDADARQLSAHLTATAANGTLGFAEGEHLVDILDRSASRLQPFEDRIVELLVLLRCWQEANSLREEAARHVKNQAWRLAQAGLVRAHVLYEDLGVSSEELRTLSLLARVQMARGQYFEASELLKTLALSAQESGDEESAFAHGVLFLQARLNWAREHALLDPSAQHDLHHQADLLAGMAGGELTRMLRCELLSYVQETAIPPPPLDKSLPSPLTGEGKGEGADVFIRLGFPMNALAALAGAEAEQNARPVLDESALDRLRWLKARAAVMAFANNVLREPPHFFSLKAVVDGLVMKGESNLAEKNYNLCQLDFLTALVMAYESHDPAMAAKIRSKLSAFYGSHGAMMVELMEKRRAKRDLLDAGMTLASRAITEDGEIVELLAAAVAEMPADEKAAYVQKAKRFGGNALKARATKNFGSELLFLLAAGHAYLEGGFFAEWLQVEHSITVRLKEQGFYAASHHWNTSLKNVDPLIQTEPVAEEPRDSESLAESTAPVVTKQKFALGAESLSAWAEECLYGLIRMHAEGQNYGGASELAFPDTSFTSPRGGKVRLTLQLGYYFESGKDGIPKTLGAVPEKELKWVMDQLTRRAGELGVGLLDVMERRSWVANEVHGILRVLGFWLPKHLEFLREEGWDEEKINAQVFNFLDGAETPDAIIEALKGHLQQALKAVSDWKGEQTSKRVVERRKQKGILPPTFSQFGGRKRGGNSRTRPTDVPAEIDIGDGPPDSGDLGDIKASSSMGIGGRALEIGGGVFGQALFDGSAALQLESWEAPVIVAEPAAKSHLQLVEPTLESDQDAADPAILDSGADAELDHSATQHPALFGNAGAISRTNLHHPLFRVVR